MSKKFQSATELLQDLTDDQELVDEVAKQTSERVFVKHLIAHRVREGLSQADIANSMDCTQSRVSKLESSTDDELKLGEIERYLDATELAMAITIMRKPATAVDQIKFHALRIKQLLESLVELADDEDEEVADGIAKFTCFETPLNLLKIVSDSISKLPESVKERLPIANEIDSYVSCAADEPVDCNSTDDESCIA